MESETRYPLKTPPHSLQDQRLDILSPGKVDFHVPLGLGKWHGCPPRCANALAHFVHTLYTICRVRHLKEAISVDRPLLVSYSGLVVGLPNHRPVVPSSANQVGARLVGSDLPGGPAGGGHHLTERTGSTGKHFSTDHMLLHAHYTFICYTFTCFTSYDPWPLRRGGTPLSALHTHHAFML